MNVAGGLPPGYHVLPNGTPGSGLDQSGPNHPNAMPRIQLLSNNVDNVNYYDDNQQVSARFICQLRGCPVTAPSLYYS